MRAEHRRTLAQVFRRPTPRNLRWADVEAMLEAAGVDVKERSGSRIALVKDGEVMVMRRPHDKPIAVRATVQDLAAFLRAAEVKP